jgi:hypothetical protein
MDMTYFALFPQALKPRKLKISLVFLHEDFRFEVWLSGANRSVQVETWKRLKDSDYQGYRLAADPRREDYVMAHTLVAAPGFGDLDELTRRIASGTMSFILDVEGILAGI